MVIIVMRRKVKKKKRKERRRRQMMEKAMAPMVPMKLNKILVNTWIWLTGMMLQAKKIIIN